MEKKYWIDDSEGHPVIMTTNGRMSWKEAIIESWKSCKKAEPNVALYLIFGIITFGVIIALILH